MESTADTTDTENTDKLLNMESTADTTDTETTDTLLNMESTADTTDTENTEECCNVQESENTEDDTQLKYSLDTLISAATNRPVEEGESRVKPHLFFCEVCNVKLTHPMAAVMHFSSKSHLGKAKEHIRNPQSAKRKQNNSNSSGPSAKFMKNAIPRGSHNNNRRNNWGGGGFNRGGGGFNRGAGVFNRGGGGFNQGGGWFNQGGGGFNQGSGGFNMGGRVFNQEDDYRSNYSNNGMWYGSDNATSYPNQQWGSGNDSGFQQEQSQQFNNQFYGSSGGGYQGKNQVDSFYGNQQQAFGGTSMPPQGDSLMQYKGNAWRD